MNIRQQLVETALKWEKRFGVAPSITSALSEYDAALLLGFSETDYSAYMQDSSRTAVSKGFDFKYNDKLYQIKANRPSGKLGSKVTRVSKAKNYDWDYLIWILYYEDYNIKEAWLWRRKDYEKNFDSLVRLTPEHMRKGEKLNVPGQYKKP